MIKIYNKNGVILNTQDKYCNENIEVAIDTTDLTPENIVKGKRILGIDGTAEAGSGGIPEGYIKPEGTIEITENGTVDVTSYASAEINVPTGGVTPKGEIIIEAEGTHDVTEYASAYVSIPKQQKTVTPTKSEQRVWPDSGRLLSGVTVNPIPDEYIMPSGNFEITANGDYDISDKESVSVNVAGSGEGDSLWTEVMEGKLAKQDMSYAFYQFVGNDINKYLQGFDTSAVGYWDHTFQYCQQLTSLAPFDTTGATSMQYIFSYCQQLQEAPDLNTSRVTNVSNAFLTSGLAKIPNWDFSKVRTFTRAFENCKNLKEAVLDTSSATDIGYLFQGCNYLKSVEISTMDTITSQYNVSSYCKSCYSLESFTIRNMTKVPVFYNSSYAYPFVDDYHFTGTFHQVYNPEGLQDAGIYVPDEMVDSLKAATGWSYYGDVIFPLSIKEERTKKTKPYITLIERYSTSYTTFDMLKDGSKYYYNGSYQPLCKFAFTVPENATSNTLTYEVEIAGSDTQRPWTVLFGKLDTVVGNYLTPELCHDYKEQPEAQTYTVTYTDLTPGEHFIYIGANQRTQSTATTQYFKFRRIYE